MEQDVWNRTFGEKRMAQKQKQSALNAMIENLPGPFNRKWVLALTIVTVAVVGWFIFTWYTTPSGEPVPEDEQPTGASAAAQPFAPPQMIMAGLAPPPMANAGTEIPETYLHEHFRDEWKYCYGQVRFDQNMGDKYPTVRRIAELLVLRFTSDESVEYVLTEHGSEAARDLLRMLVYKDCTEKPPEPKPQQPGDEGPGGDGDAGTETQAPAPPKKVDAGIYHMIPGRTGYLVRRTGWGDFSLVPAAQEKPEKEEQ